MRVVKLPVGWKPQPPQRFIVVRTEHSGHRSTRWTIRDTQRGRNVARLRDGSKAHARADMLNALAVAVAVK